MRRYLISIFTLQSRVQYPQILLALAMLYVSIDIMCNVLVYRLVKIGPFLQTGGIFFYPLVFLISDMIAELYGFKLARLVILYDLLLNFFVAAGFLIVINMPAPHYWHHSVSYHLVLGHLLWLNFSVLVGILVGSLLNVLVMVKLKAYFYGHHFWFRSIISSLVGETVMLIITLTMLFHGTLSDKNIERMILSDYTFKVIYAVIGAFPANILINILRKYEDNNYRSIDFNPFDKSNGAKFSN